MNLQTACSAVLTLCACAAGLLAAGAPATEEPQRQPDRKRYELVTETAMPHLEENLRYATTRENRCIDIRDLSRAFPVLDHASLQDCELVKTDEGSRSAVYALRCRGGHGTTGQARWQFAANSISGTLSVRLGGKNMTFYQRITGRVLGSCSDF